MKKKIQKIIKTELFGGEFNKICDIDFNIDFILPIYMIQYTPIYVKITFDNIINIPNNIKLTFTGGLLQKEYRNNKNIIYPLNNYIHNGEIMVHAPDISNFNIIIKSNEYTLPFGYIYKILSKYDCFIELLFGGNTSIRTNLLDIDIIPSIAEYHSVKILTIPRNLELELELEIIPKDNLLYSNNQFTINNTVIKIKEGVYIS